MVTYTDNGRVILGQIIPSEPSQANLHNSVLAYSALSYSTAPALCTAAHLSATGMKDMFPTKLALSHKAINFLTLCIDLFKGYSVN